MDSSVPDLGWVFSARRQRDFFDSTRIGCGRAAAKLRRSRRHQRRRLPQALQPRLPQRSLHHETLRRCHRRPLPDATLAGETALGDVGGEIGRGKGESKG